MHMSPEWLVDTNVGGPPGHNAYWPGTSAACVASTYMQTFLSECCRTRQIIRSENLRASKRNAATNKIRLTDYFNDD